MNRKKVDCQNSDNISLYQISLKNNDLDQLRQSEAEFRGFIENLSVMFYAVEPRPPYPLLYISPAFAQLGYPFNEWITNNYFWQQILHPEDRDRALEKTKTALRSGTGIDHEYRLIAKDGTTHWVRDCVSLTRDKQGNLLRWQGIIFDVTEQRQAEKYLRESEAQFKSAFEDAAVGMAISSLDGRWIKVNQRLCEMLGYAKEELLDRRFVEATHPDDVQADLDSRSHFIDDPNFIHQREKRYIHKNGQIVWVYLSVSMVRSAKGKPKHFIAEMQDITEQKRTERALKDSERKYRLLGEGIMHQVWTAPPNGRLNYVNRRTLLYFGRANIRKSRGRWQYFTHPDDLLRCDELWKHSLKTGDDYVAEYRLRRHDGEYFWFQGRATAGRDPDGNIISWFGTNTDIDDQKRAEEKLHHIAGHDTLTNLPNRTKFMDHLTRTIRRSEFNPLFQFAVLFLDLDRFKIINDSLGHTVGDKLLIALSQRLEECLRPSDIVARLGGDEFTILLSGFGDHTHIAVQVAERILEKLSEPFKIDTYEVFTSVSIGIIVSGDVKREPEDFLRDADTAMYRAKAAGKSRYEIFDREMHIRNINLLQMETDLRRAIERKEFRAFYQPIVDLETGKILELEALIRWQHPQHGLVPPNDFIGIAEETGLIVPIGKWILGEACRQIADWQRRFPKRGRLSIGVNLSAKQLLHPNIIQQVEEVLERTGLDPHCLKLEVTESMVMENSEKSLAVINAFHALGISISTDDFGTGYSSLSYLHQFPFNRLKIDRSFVGKMEKDVKSEAIVRTILMLGHNLEIETLAEGIENKLQLSKLRTLGCRLGQGYFFSKPVDAATAEKLLKDGLTAKMPLLKEAFA